jgi:nicotine oxidoreductase
MGLSSCFILLGSSLVYANSGTTLLDGIYVITSLSDIGNNGHAIGYATADNILYWYKPYYINFSLLILSVGFLFKISAAPFHFWSPDVYDAIPTIVTTFVAIVAKISIFIFLLELVHYTSNSLFSFQYNWTTSLLVSSLLSLVIGTVVGLTQLRIKRLFAYSTIVRQCASSNYGFEKTRHCPIMSPTTDLDKGESLLLNLAYPIKGKIRSKQNDRIASRVVISMVKATLLEVYLLGTSTIGSWLVCNRSCIIKGFYVIVRNLMGWYNRIRITYLNVKSEQPKEIWRLNEGTLGLPKAKNGYGNRAIVVPLNSFCLNLSSQGNPWVMERIAGQKVRGFSSAAGDLSTVKSDATKKLRRLSELCIKNPNAIINEPIINHMYNYRLYELAYDKLKSNPGNMTQGINPTTLDGISSDTITSIIESIKNDSFKFTPGRRVQIPKNSGGFRPLTIASPLDKLVQEVMRMILESIFEPTFHPSSHGFRPKRGCHTALKEIKQKFGVASWYIEGDISKCFDSFDHKILIGIIREKIRDERFIRLIIKALNAGYFEFTTYKQSLIGTPQGSIVSPLLSNIYLNGLDNFIEKLKEDFDVGTKPKANPLWISYRNKKVRAKTIEDKQKWHQLLTSTPSTDLMDDSFKKLVFVRYADDWIIGVRGTKEDCKGLLDQISNYLKVELKLNLSETKTLITNARKEKAIFLGTSIGISQHQSYSRTYGYSTRNAKEIRMEAPKNRIIKKLNESGIMKGDVAIPKYIWNSNTKDEIILLYNSIYRGIINYYSFTHNLNELSSWVHFTLKTSCVKLLANKFSLGTKSKVYKIYGKNLKGSDKVSFIEAKYGMKLWDFKTGKLDSIKSLFARNISAASLLNLSYSICDSKYRVEMHHVRRMKDLNPKLNKIDAAMARRRRKQIPLCRACHIKHHGWESKS